jgi:hypothetical protein
VAVPRLEHGPCAVAALEAWLAIREKKKGPVFVVFSPHGEPRATRIEGRLVAEVVKRLFRDAGAAASDVDAIGARAGFATAAARAGRTEAAIMRHGRWKSVQVSPAATSARAPVGSTIPSPRSAYNPDRWLAPVARDSPA